MNIQTNMIKKESIEKAYLSHLLRYVGVGLISGSIVHMGTLGGGYIRYAVLIGAGVIIFILGTLLEKREAINSLTRVVIVSVIMSIGVGMVSGGTQHYLDGPLYAAFLIPIGMTVGYFAFLFKDYRNEITIKRILSMIFISLGLIVVLYLIAGQIPKQEDHHFAEIGSDVERDNHGH